jgi:DEAD/DEAH box helicase domain-containing protein
MSLASLLETWGQDAEMAPNLAAWRRLPAAPGRFAPVPPGLHPVVSQALAARGIRCLYSHQAEAWDLCQQGENVVVVTGTASGKTLCYNLPVLDVLLRDPGARALYLFPTKALSQDQRDELASFFPAGATAVPVATYDGDTPAQARSAIRGHARVLISNPDMLHTGILPHHTLWAAFLRDLRYVVIDEMHAYRGVFGSHVANVLRRLRRICAFYGSAPQFILTSATIGNPAELAERLIEAPVRLVDQDGSRRGARHFLLYNPPVVDQALGIRRSALLESVRLTQDLRDHGVQTIVFARSRRSVEKILRYLQDGQAAGGRQDVRGYRGGYLPAQRREIEHGLRQGSVRTVVATSALELGVDIGGMGAAVLAGYPGTIAGAWQQAGRAGRGSDESLAVLVASADPLDQFLAHHADFFFGRSPEQALINPDNLLILLQHVRCAAFELPFRDGDGFGRVPPGRLMENLDFLDQSGVVHHSAHRYFWMSEQYPAQDVSLRSASAQRVTLQAEGVTIGEVDEASAAWMVHPQAVYLHEARSYMVEDLDLVRRVAHLRPSDVDYYTEPRRETTVALLDILAEGAAQGSTKAHGEIAVTTTVTGFRKVQWLTHQHLGDGEVLLPSNELHTTGYWLALDGGAVDALRAQGLWSNDANDYGADWPNQRDAARARDGHRCQSCGAAESTGAHQVHHRRPFRTFRSAALANDLANLVTLCVSCHRRVEVAVRVRSGLAGLGYALGHLAPLFLMCDSEDVGVHSDPQSPLAEGRPAVLIYDQAPAGIGFSERLYELHDELVARGLELVQTCPCEEGCPACVGPAGENGVGGKADTLAILQALAATGALTGGEADGIRFHA